MSLHSCFHYEQVATAIFQYLGDLRFVGVLNCINQPLVDAMKNMVKGQQRHSGLRLHGPTIHVLVVHSFVG